MVARQEFLRGLTGQAQFRLGPRRHDDFAPQHFSAELPAAGGAPLRGVELTFGGLEASARFGSEENLLVTGGQRAETADDAIHPLAHRAIGVVVEGIHADVTKTMFFGVAVPPLPHSRRAVAHGVEPGRIVFLQQDLVSQIGAAESGEHGQ